MAGASAVRAPSKRRLREAGDELVEDTEEVVVEEGRVVATLLLLLLLLPLLLLVVEEEDDVEDDEVEDVLVDEGGDATAVGATTIPVGPIEVGDERDEVAEVVVVVVVWTGGETEEVTL